MRNCEKLRRPHVPCLPRSPHLQPTIIPEKKYFYSTNSKYFIGDQFIELSKPSNLFSMFARAWKYSRLVKLNTRYIDNANCLSTFLISAWVVSCDCDPLNIINIISLQGRPLCLRVSPYIGDKTQIWSQGRHKLTTSGPLYHEALQLWQQKQRNC